MDAAHDLEENGVGSVVINLHTIKPIDEQTLIHWAKVTGAVVTVEEHQTAGGMGSAVAEVLAKNFPVPIEFVGVEDSFGESAKTYQELMVKFGLTKENIMESVKRVMTRKNS
jgi:transketolase